MVDSLFIDKPVQFQGPSEIIQFNLIQIVCVSFHLVYVYADPWIGLINLLSERYEEAIKNSAKWKYI